MIVLMIPWKVLSGFTEVEFLEKYVLLYKNKEISIYIYTCVVKQRNTQQTDMHAYKQNTVNYHW